jgi:CubicO group peptidase (beta-lactamase class C family)
VLDLVETWCRDAAIPGAGLLVLRGGKSTGTHLFGRQSAAADAPPIREDALFLIASITKPVVGAAVLLLMERGLLTLDERVEEFLPAFGKHSKHAITIRNLLTHTSGLPDMLPRNRELRMANAPLADFITDIYGISPDFAAGRGVQYQSTGFAILAKIVEELSKKTCAQFLQDEFFSPLGMRETVLGAPDSWFIGENPQITRIAGLRLTAEQANETTWNWHSRYWRQLGAPWGGMLTTPSDLARYAQMWLQRGEFEGRRYLSAATVDAATRNQLESMKDVPADDRRCRPWGLGWRLNWPAHSANFGDLLSSSAYGHWGATGTALWIDPARDAICVFFTTQPQEPNGKYLSRLSNAVCAAFE